MTKISWTWRHAILKSKLPPTTRHVLLTISCYMNDVGGACYPTIEDLAEATGLTERAIVKHVGVASRAGWLTVKKHGFKGRRWQNNEYEAKWPDLIEALEQPTPKPRKTRAKKRAETPVQPVENPVDDLFETTAKPGGGSERGSLPRNEGVESDEVVNLTTRGHESKGIGVVNHVPTKVPESFQNPPMRASAREEGGEEDGFQEFWEACPETIRPDNRDHARKLFLALSKADRLIAFSAWETYRKACAYRSKPTRMIVYLKDRLFAVYHDAPEIDRDGDFRITPDRPEWGPWLASIRKEHGEELVKIAAAGKLMVRKTRWPEGFDPATLEKGAA